MNTSNLCEMAKLLADSKLLSIVHFVQIIISIFCLLSIAINLPFKCLKYKPVALHQNLKVENLKIIFPLYNLKILLTCIIQILKFLDNYFQCSIFLCIEFNFYHSTSTKPSSNQSSLFHNIIKFRLNFTLIQTHVIY